MEKIERVFLFVQRLAIRLPLYALITVSYPVIWDDVAYELKARQMPPEDEPDLSRPTEAEYDVMVAWLNERLATVKKAPLIEPALTVLDKHCTSCHSDTDAQSGLNITTLITEPLHKHSNAWEGIIRKMNARQMPPVDKRWPDEDTYQSVIHYLEAAMDTSAKSKPNPGRTSTFRRLTRTEYQNSIRDLLAINIKSSDLLPRDEVSHGFDNITVTDLSPTLMNSYISAAEKVSRLAVGTSLPSPKIDVVRVKPDLTQSKRLEGMSLGTRGGLLIPHHFPRSGTYRVEIKLARDRNEFVEGLNGKYSVLLMLNKEVLKTFKIERPKGKLPHDKVDQHLNFELEIEAGEQELAVTFAQSGNSLFDRRREPHEASFNYHRHPRQEPAVYQVTITGRELLRPRVGKKYLEPPPLQRLVLRFTQNKSSSDLLIRPIVDLYRILT